ncbi:RmlC-like cupin domain-containing protein [Paramyrothecium foliicola]|nr:RmlC-like cupin domain-containing protein [Paramyrothecium foliicola]
MAAPPVSQFFNPFYTGHLPTAPVHVPESVHVGIPDGLESAPLVPQPTFTLPIAGQGTIAVSSDAKTLLELSVTTDLLGSPTLHLVVGVAEVLLYYENETGKHDIPYCVTKTNKETMEDCMLNVGVKTTYWLSLDANNGMLRYGKYYTSKAMTLIEAQLKFENSGGLMVWREPTKFSWLERVKTVEATQDQGESLVPIIHPLPVVIDRSPFVRPADQVTLLDLDSGTYTAPANLPEACQVLYGNVAGTKIVLADDDFPDFAEAIQYSCSTPGRWGYEKLAEKAGEFTSDPNGTYLRITLGYNLGDSPGIPYVLEIWPSMHYSPIHDHGDACAVIKVLHGSINCTWYTSLTKPIEIGRASLRKGNVTWIGDNNYQIHKLHNTTPTVCCTIQCYRYKNQDNVHFDGFRWIDDKGEPHKFPPNSDKAFHDFRDIIKQEWEDACRTKA